MALDGNGIWQYQETDAAATASQLLNRLASSTSQRVGALATAVDGKEPELGDTGWVALPINGDFQAFSTVLDVPEYRRRGDWVELTGKVKPSNATVAANLTTTGSGQSIITTLPAGLWPVKDRVAVMQGSGVARWALSVNSTDGTVRCGRYAGGTPGVSSWLPFSIMYYVG